MIYQKRNFKWFTSFRLQGTEHTPTPPRTIDCLYLVGVACSIHSRIYIAPLQGNYSEWI